MKDPTFGALGMIFGSFLAVLLVEAPLEKLAISAICVYCYILGFHIGDGRRLPLPLAVSAVAAAGFTVFAGL
jgi:hypothetical protein